MAFREEFEKFRKPKDVQKSSVALPSFRDVRIALKNVKIDEPLSGEQKLLQDNLLKIGESRATKTSISSPTGFEKPLLDTNLVKDKSVSKESLKLSDFIIPEVRKGIADSFGKAENGASSDIYTEMIPAFGKKRAFDIATAYQSGVDAFGYPKGITLTDPEKKQFDGWKQKHWALIALDATDLIGLGIAIKSATGFVSRTGLRRAVSTAAKEDNIKNIHAKILEQLPDLKGTKELEDVTDLIITAREQSPDKLAKIIEKRFKDTQTTPQAPFATEAQRIVYENGIPVLRKTTPDTFIVRRKAVIDALKGDSEGLRLSNADILAQEIRAGALPINTTRDATIPVWRISPRGRRIKSGEEISFSEDFAKQLSEGAKPQKIDVSVDDLIRLPDGTYTFVPERLIKEAPIFKTPKNIPTQVVKDATQKEAKVIADRLAKEKADADIKRQAREKAEKELRKPIEEAKKKIKQIEDRPIQIRKETQARILKESDIRSKEILLVNKNAAKEISDIDKRVLKAKQEASLAHIKRMKTAKTKLQKQKERIRYQNEIKRITKKATFDKVVIKGAQKKKISNLNAKSRLRSIQIRKEGNKSLKEAQKAVRGTRGEVQAILKKVDSPTQTSKEVVETVSNETTKSPSKRSGKESLKPVGEGAVKESRLYESVQTRVREVQKELGQNINSKDYEFYRRASNKGQLEKASAYVAKNGVEETIKALEVAFRTGGDAVPGVLNNSLLLALEPELLKTGMSKYADRLIRLSSRMATRFGQEIQILSVMDRNNPLYVLRRLQDNLDSLVSDSDIAGVTINTGARTKAEKVITDMVAKIDIKEGAKQAVDDIIC